MPSFSLENNLSTVSSTLTKIAPLIHPVMETSEAIVSVEETVERLFSNENDGIL